MPAGVSFDGASPQQGRPCDLVPGPHQIALKDKLRTAFAEKTREEWIAFATDRDCCLEQRRR